MHPRRVPVPLKSNLKEKIDEMEKQGIIVKETKPTGWISSLVAVQKPGKLRMWIEPLDLNRAIKRPKYQMPTVVEVLLKPKMGFIKLSLTMKAHSLQRSGLLLGDIATFACHKESAASQKNINGARMKRS